MTRRDNPATFVPLTQAVLSFALSPKRRQEMPATWLGIVGKDPVRILVGLSAVSANSLLRNWPGEFVVDLLAQATPWSALAGRVSRGGPGEGHVPPCQLQLSCSGGTILREAGSLQVCGELRGVVHEGARGSELDEDDPCLALARYLGLCEGREAGSGDNR